MKFFDAYNQMLKGKKIKRPCFKGHWYLDGTTGDLVIQLATGESITDGKLGLTVQNTLAEDWIVVKE